MLDSRKHPQDLQFRFTLTKTLLENNNNWIFIPQIYEKVLKRTFTLENLPADGEVKILKGPK